MVSAEHLNWRSLLNCPIFTLRFWCFGRCFDKLEKSHLKHIIVWMKHQLWQTLRGIKDCDSTCINRWCLCLFHCALEGRWQSVFSLIRLACEIILHNHPKTDRIVRIWTNISKSNLESSAEWDISLQKCQKNVTKFTTKSARRKTQKGAITNDNKA